MEMPGGRQDVISLLSLTRLASSFDVIVMKIPMYGHFLQLIGGWRNLDRMF